MNVTVVGTGYVGLTTGACLAAAGHDVTCVDVDPARVAAVEARRAPFYEPGLAELLASDDLHASTDLAEAARASDVIIIAVGTPEAASGVDLSFIHDAPSAVGESLRGSGRYHVIAVKSTVPPGTTDVVVSDAVKAGSGLEAGECRLAMHPELLRPGSAVAGSVHRDRIVVGHQDERTRRVMAE